MGDSGAGVLRGADISAPESDALRTDQADETLSEIDVERREWKTLS